MKARTKFLKMFYKMPDNAKGTYGELGKGMTPMSLHVCACEIRNKTKLGDLILKEMGYEDDEK